MRVRERVRARVRVRAGGLEGALRQTETALRKSSSAKINAVLEYGSGKKRYRSDLHIALLLNREALTRA